MPSKEESNRSGVFPAYKRGIFAILKSSNLLNFLTFFILISFSFGVSGFIEASAAPGVPRIVNYQGRLANSSGSLLGGASGTPYFFKFSIWSTSLPESGNKLWPSGDPGTSSSTVIDGVFNVSIGDTANGYPDELDYDFYTSSDSFLQVEVSADGFSFETLSPRQRIGASGFALNANTLSGKLRASSTADYTFDVINDGSGRANLNSEGQVKIGGFNGAPTSIGGGSLYYNTATGQLFVWNDATSTPKWVSVGGATGGGSTDLQGAYNLGNSIQTTSNKDILFTLAPAAVDSDFIVNISATSTGIFQIQASDSPILSIGRNYVTSTAALSWNIQGVATLATTTISNLTFANATGTGALSANTLLIVGRATTSQLTISGLTGLTQCLTVDANGLVSGTGVACGSGAGGGTPGGATNQIQYNNGGTFAGDGNFLWASSTKLFTVTGTSSLDRLTFANATGTGTLHLSAAGTPLQVTAGTSALQGLTFTNATGTSASITTLSGTNLNYTTATTTNFSFTSATGTTRLTLSGATNPLQVTAGTSALQGLTFTNATGTAANITTLTGTGFTFTNGTSTNFNFTTATGTAARIGTLTLTNALGIASGGTGLSGTPTNGQLLIGNGTNYSLATLTPGTAIGIQNAAGTITITNLGVQSASAGTGISVSNATGTVTIANTRPFVTSTIAGLTDTSFIFAGAGGVTISTSTSPSTITVTNNGVRSLAGSTYLGVSSATGTITLTNNGVQLLTAGSNITLTSATGTPTIAVTSTPSFTLVMIGTVSTSTGKLNVVGNDITAASAVSGIYQESQLNSSVLNAFQFGNRHIINMAPTATSSLIGEFVRTIDNTSFGNTVHGMQVQAWSGTNIQGINTGVWAAGRTFGVQAFTNGTAGGVSVPAAIFADVQNDSQGQALRLYSDDIASSSQDMAQFYQEISNFQGTGLKMDFARTGGTFTGNFLSLMSGGSTKLAVNATGTLMIGTATQQGVANLVVCAQSNCTLPTASDTVAIFGSVDGTTGTRSISAKGTITGQLADLGEFVPVVGSKNNYEMGDLLSIESSTSTRFRKSLGRYDAGLSGVVTPVSAFIAGGEIEGADDSVIMALSGRVKVKVTGENGSIKAGDAIVASSRSGFGMKANRPGRVVGVALEDFSGSDKTNEGRVMVFINPHWALPTIVETLQGGEAGTMEINTFAFGDENKITVGTMIAGKITVKDLTIGSAEEPGGVTMFDRKTKQPYCLVLEGGTTKTYPGKCEGNSFDSSAPIAIPATLPTEPTVRATSTEEIIIEENGALNAETSGATSTDPTSASEPIVESTAEPIAEPAQEPTPEPTSEQAPLAEDPPAELVTATAE